MDIHIIENAIKHLKARNFTGQQLDMAIKALEKQIPKKPIIKEYYPAYCPACGDELSESEGEGYYKHYTHLNICDCGQKLKWY